MAYVYVYVYTRIYICSTCTWHDQRKKVSAKGLNTAFNCQCFSKSRRCLKEKRENSVSKSLRILHLPKELSSPPSISLRYTIIFPSCSPTLSLRLEGLFCSLFYTSCMSSSSLEFLSTGVVTFPFCVHCH